MSLAQNRRIILASASEIRATMLRNAGLNFNVRPGRVDEEAIRHSLEAEGASARDLADTLAEMKARKVSERDMDALVIGADQVLECDGRVFAKPDTQDDAREHLKFLRGKTHRLLSAAVVCEGGRPIWRQVGTVRLTMHEVSDAMVADYVSRNWESIRHAVGCYKIEEEGVRLFARIEGDFFHILGLPLIELLTWLRIRGDIPA
jgi:septum formation protein